MKSISWKIVVLSLLLVVAAFAPEAMAAAAKKTPITLWFGGASPAVVEWAKTYEAEFNAANPDIELHFETVDGTTWQQTLLVAVAAGAGPDISYMSANLMPEQINRGLTLALDPYLERWTDFGDILPDVFAVVKDGQGRIHGMPFAMWSIFDLYNMNALQESGVAPPDDWDSLIAAARKMTIVNPDSTVARYGYAVGQNSLMAIYNLHLAMEQLGRGMLYMGETKVDLNNERGIRAANYLRELWMTGMPDGATGAQAIGNSISGKTAISGYGTYTIMDVNMEDSAPLEPMRVVGPVKGQDGVRFNCGVLYILPTSKNQDLAWRVLADFMTREVNSQFIKHQVSYLPVRRSMLGQIRNLVTHPLAQKMANIMYSPMNTYGVVHEYWADIRYQGGDQILPALMGKTGINTALEEAERQMNAILAEKMR